MMRRRVEKRGFRPNPKVPGLDKMYLVEKLSINQIAKRMGFPPSRIHAQLKEEGVKLRTRTEGFLLRTDRKPHVVPRKRRTIE